jgi:hypothetical protein
MWRRLHRYGANPNDATAREPGLEVEDPGDDVLGRVKLLARVSGLCLLRLV